MTPLSLALDAAGLQVRWPDHDARLSAHLLRSHCRCTDCRRTEAVNTPAAALTGIAPVGDYGVQLRFSDGHERGIYPWVYLRELSGLRQG